MGWGGGGGLVDDGPPRTPLLITDGGRGVYHVLRAVNSLQPGNDMNF